LIKLTRFTVETVKLDSSIEPKKDGTLTYIDVLTKVPIDLMSDQVSLIHPDYGKDDLHKLDSVS